MKGYEVNDNTSVYATTQRQIYTIKEMNHRIVSCIDRTALG